ncbi:MAG TPA: ABC transporter ATPase [Bacteroidia bacterium]|nr:ABC transporter ATPase [Bacteroidia bacterium]
MTTNRVWVYLSNKPFDEQIENNLKTDVQNFLSGWNAHGKALMASAEILHHHFIIIKADEEQYSASGCSIDKQFQFIKETEKKYNLNLLDRLLVAYKKDNSVFVAHSSKIPQLLADGVVNENTIVFNTTLANEDEFKTAFEIPLKQSWLNKFLITAK